jgi:predicted enzyme related to lactoylglutathione lyase
MTSEISYIEIGAGDAGRASGFFSALFGWPFHPMGDAGDGWFETPSLKAGLHGNDPDGGIVVYFRVPDLEAAIAKVRELGGEAEDRIADEEGFGRFCNCRGPQGIRFGLHQI